LQFDLNGSLTLKGKIGDFFIDIGICKVLSNYHLTYNKFSFSFCNLRRCIPE